MDQREEGVRNHRRRGRGTVGMAERVVWADRTYIKYLHRLRTMLYNTEFSPSGCHHGNEIVNCSVSCMLGAFFILDLVTIVLF